MNLLNKLTDGAILPILQKEIAKAREKSTVISAKEQKTTEKSNDDEKRSDDSDSDDEDDDDTIGPLPPKDEPMEENTK